jgi:hypothetical protein
MCPFIWYVFSTSSAFSVVLNSLIQAFQHFVTIVRLMLTMFFLKSCYVISTEVTFILVYIEWLATTPFYPLTML